MWVIDYGPWSGSLSQIKGISDSMVEKFCKPLSSSIRLRISSPVAGMLSLGICWSSKQERACLTASQTDKLNINGGSPTALLRQMLIWCSGFSTNSTEKCSGMSLMSSVFESEPKCVASRQTAFRTRPFWHKSVEHWALYWSGQRGIGRRFWNVKNVCVEPYSIGSSTARKYYPEGSIV